MWHVAARFGTSLYLLAGRNKRAVLVVFAEPALHSDVSAKPDMWFAWSPLRFFPSH